MAGADMRGQGANKGANKAVHVFVPNGKINKKRFLMVVFLTSGPMSVIDGNYTEKQVT